jgi:hypothetical protein
MTSVETHLVVDPNTEPTVLARTASPRVLRVLRDVLLEEAEQRVTSSHTTGPRALAAVEEADLIVLRAVLDELVPDEPLEGDPDMGEAA